MFTAAKLKMTEIRVFIDPIISMASLQIVMTNGWSERESSKVGEQRVKPNKCIKIAKDKHVSRVGVQYIDGEIYGITVENDEGESDTISTSRRGKWFYMRLKKENELTGFYGYTRYYRETDFTTIAALGIVTQSRNKWNIRPLSLLI